MKLIFEVKDSGACVSLSQLSSWSINNHTHELMMGITAVSPATVPNQPPAPFICSCRIWNDKLKKRKETSVFQINSLSFFFFYTRIRRLFRWFDEAIVHKPSTESQVSHLSHTTWRAKGNTAFVKNERSVRAIARGGTALIAGFLNITQWKQRAFTLLSTCSKYPAKLQCKSSKWSPLFPTPSHHYSHRLITDQQFDQSQHH